MEANTAAPVTQSVEHWTLHLTVVCSDPAWVTNVSPLFLPFGIPDLTRKRPYSLIYLQFIYLPLHSIG